MKAYINTKSIETFLGNDKLAEFPVHMISKGVSYDNVGLTSIQAVFSLYLESDNHSIQVVEFECDNKYGDVLAITLQGLGEQIKSKQHALTKKHVISGPINLKIIRDECLQGIINFFHNEFDIKFDDWYFGESATDINSLFDRRVIVTKKLEDTIVYEFAYFISNNNRKLLDDMLSNRPDVVNSDFKSFITKNPKHMVTSIRLLDVTETHRNLVLDFVKLRANKREA